MQRTYAELHSHTNFSFLHGASPVEDMAERAAALGLTGLAVTDHDGLYGVVLDQVPELSSLWGSFQAEPASSEVAEILAVRPGAPVLVHESLTAGSDGLPLLFVRRHARSDRVRYVVDYEA